MKEFFRKNKEFIWISLVTIVVGIIYFFFYVPNNDIATMLLYTLNTNIVAALLTAVGVGIFLHKLESGRRIGERRLLQRVELRKRALECFEEINKLIIKIRFYKTPESYDHKDIRVSFDQMANFFVELREVYQKIPGAIPKMETVDKLDKFYQGWNKYFSFEKPEDLESFKKSVKDAEEYLACLKKALIEFIETLQLE